MTPSYWAPNFENNPGEWALCLNKTSNLLEEVDIANVGVNKRQNFVPMLSTTLHLLAIRDGAIYPSQLHFSYEPTFRLMLDVHSENLLDQGLGVPCFPCQETHRRYIFYPFLHQGALAINVAIGDIGDNREFG